MFKVGFNVNALKDMVHCKYSCGDVLTSADLSLKFACKNLTSLSFLLRFFINIEYKIITARQASKRKHIQYSSLRISLARM